MPKPRLPLRVLETIGKIETRTGATLESCAEQNCPVPGYLFDLEKMTAIMRASVRESFEARIAFYDSQPGYCEQWLDEILTEAVSATIGLCPSRFKLGFSRFRDVMPEIRDELVTELKELKVRIEPTVEQAGTRNDARATLEPRLESMQSQCDGGDRSGTIFEGLSASDIAGFHIEDVQSAYQDAFSEFAPACDDTFSAELPPGKPCSHLGVRAAASRLSKRLPDLFEKYVRRFTAGIDERVDKESDPTLTAVWRSAVIQEWTKRLWRDTDEVWITWLDQIRKMTEGTVFGARVRAIYDPEFEILMAHQRLMRSTLWSIAAKHSIPREVVSEILLAREVDRRPLIVPSAKQEENGYPDELRTGQDGQDGRAAHTFPELSDGPIGRIERKRASARSELRQCLKTYWLEIAASQYKQRGFEPDDVVRFFQKYALAIFEANAEAYLGSANESPQQFVQFLHDDLIPHVWSELDGDSGVWRVVMEESLVLSDFSFPRVPGRSIHKTDFLAPRRRNRIEAALKDCIDEQWVGKAWDQVGPRVQTEEATSSHGTGTHGGTASGPNPVVRRANVAEEPTQTATGTTPGDARQTAPMATTLREQGPAASENAAEKPADDRPSGKRNPGDSPEADGDDQNSAVPSSGGHADAVSSGNEIQHCRSTASAGTRQEQLASFIARNPGTTYADVRYSADVHKPDFQDWRQGKLPSSSVMSERIENVLKCKTVLSKKPRKSRND